MGIKQRPLSALFPMHLPNLVQNGDEETLREITIEILSPEELKIKQSFVKNKSILLIESSGFVPGDQLVAVNGTNVQNLDRDEVQKLIKTALTTDAGNQSISLKVSFFFKNPRVPVVVIIHVRILNSIVNNTLIVFLSAFNI